MIKYETNKWQAVVVGMEEDVFTLDPRGVSTNDNNRVILRLFVPGGWLIDYGTPERGFAAYFYPDPNHEWLK